MSLVNTPLRKKITELLQKVNINKYIDFLGVTDTHIENKALHFKEEDIDHVKIQKIGNNTHAQIDTHIASTNKHIDWTNATEDLSTTGRGKFGGTPSIVRRFTIVEDSQQVAALIEGNTPATLIDINNDRAGDGDVGIRFNLNGTPKFTTGVDDSDGDKFVISTTAIGISNFLELSSTGNFDFKSGDLTTNGDLTAGTIQADNGFTGSFTAGSGETVTVVGGIITNVV